MKKVKGIRTGGITEPARGGLERVGRALPDVFEGGSDGVCHAVDDVSIGIGQKVGRETDPPTTPPAVWTTPPTRPDTPLRSPPAGACSSVCLLVVSDILERYFSL